MKKFILICAAVAGAVCLSLGLAGCDENGEKGKKGEELSYTLVDDSYYTVSAGDIEGVTDLVIPETYKGLPVKEIESNGFCGAYFLNSVTIPDSVISIGAFTFEGCTSLTNITIPDSVTSIGSRAFQDCGNLSYNTYDNAYYLGNDSNPYLVLVKATSTSIVSCTVHENTKIIYDQAFISCTNLTSITIPDGVTGIGEEAFYGCENLAEITIPDGITEIGIRTFSCCASLKEITIPDSATYIAGEAFYQCANLKSVTIGSGVTSIGFAAFSNCTGLTSITISESVTSLGDSAFSNCTGLTSVTIGSSVTSIGDFAFLESYKLVEVYNYSSLEIEAGSPENGYIGYYALDVYTSAEDESKLFKTEEGYIFYENGDTVYLLGYTGTDTELVLPDTYNGKSYGIYQYAFHNYTNLTKITIPDSVTSIGEHAFDNCTGLRSVTIGSGVNEIGNRAFVYCIALTELNYNATEVKDPDQNHDIFASVGLNGDGVTVRIGSNVKYIPDYLFGRFSGDTVPNFSTIEFPEDGMLESIGQLAFFDCTALINLKIGDGGISIGKEAFSYCIGLTEVTIGNGPISIGGNCFFSCTNLTDVTIGEGKVSIGAYAFSNCTNLTNVLIAGGEISIGYKAFSGFYDLDGCTSLVSVTIGEGKVSIGGRAFEGDVNAEIEIKSEIVALGKWAFSNCGGLQSVILGEELTTIGSAAFSGCTGLKGVYITDIAAWCEIITLEDDYANPLYYAGNLYLNGTLVTELVIPGGVISIRDKAFKYCISLTSITIPDSVTSIGNSAFSGCTNLANIVIPGSVASIGEYAFCDCTGLVSITIPDNITSIGDWAFFGCYKLVEVYDLSALGIEAGSTENGYVGYYALDMYTSAEAASKLTLTEEGYIFYENGKTVYLLGYTGTDTELVLPDTYNGKSYGIYQYAFYNNTSITSVTIGNGVNSISNTAFLSCSGLTSITVSSENSTYHSDGNCLIETKFWRLILGCQNSVIPTDGSVCCIDEYAFYGCTGLESIIIPDTVGDILYGAFAYCTNLKSVTMYENLFQISDFAFVYCTSLERVNIKNRQKIKLIRAAIQCGK